MKVTALAGGEEWRELCGRRGKKVPLIFGRSIVRERS